LIVFIGVVFLDDFGAARATMAPPRRCAVVAVVAIGAARGVMVNMGITRRTRVRD
jgi:HAMP domain-containing protein